MNIYLVGGAVRDELLGIPGKDRDWVVVGATEQAMRDQGFTPVGKDFPVFLHPVTHEEYALARTERKSGRGYTGFECYSGSEVTLEQDLSRRDLTINAIARQDDGTLVDPFHGQQDLQNRLLRHVSPAFVEDPLRVLRVARFLARFHDRGFQIADETLALMRDIAASGELQTLTPERVWTETEKALLEPSPWRYFEALRDCGALAVVFPELDKLFGVPQPPKHHPEIDTGIHMLLTLQAALKLMQTHPLEKADRVAVLFSLICHDLGKSMTPEYKWPSHPGHEPISAHLAEKLCIRLRAPNPVKRLSLLVSEFHTHCHRAFELKPATVMRLLEALDALRRPETLPLFLLACEADARGRTGLEDRDYPQADYIRDCAAAARLVEAKPLVELGFKGETLGIELRKRRIVAIRDVKNCYVKEQ
ncbi:MAG: multifunctional CCA addition/repair protein [Gammaproteobacteria bacterium]|nr:multifunctional CCA addition/repair protein [Gammaproteobacteria bacterium]